MVRQDRRKSSSILKRKPKKRKTPRTQKRTSRFSDESARLYSLSYGLDYCGTQCLVGSPSMMRPDGSVPHPLLDKGLIEVGNEHGRFSVKEIEREPFSDFGPLVPTNVNASVLPWFNSDQSFVSPYLLTINQNLEFPESSEAPFKICRKAHYDFFSGAAYLSFYLQGSVDLKKIAEIVGPHLHELLEPPTGSVFRAYFGSQEIEAKFTDTKRVYFYSEAPIAQSEWEDVRQRFATTGVSVFYRGPKYAQSAVTRLHRPAFICHDTRDKKSVARPIAMKLSGTGCPVWYDEFSLRVGDHLRESVERGLKECKKCILIISPHFLHNKGWTKTEFDEIFTREVLEESDVILPVWRGVTSAEVFAYSPTLANRKALDWDKLGVDEVVKQLRIAIGSPSTECEVM